MASIFDTVPTIDRIMCGVVSKTTRNVLEQRFERNRRLSTSNKSLSDYRRKLDNVVSDEAIYEAKRFVGEVGNNVKNQFEVMYFRDDKVPNRITRTTMLADSYISKKYGNQTIDGYVEHVVDKHMFNTIEDSYWAGHMDTDYEDVDSVYDEAVIDTPYDFSVSDKFIIKANRDEFKLALRASLDPSELVS